jgi:hypothetical protein
MGVRKRSSVIENHDLTFTHSFFTAFYSYCSEPGKRTVLLVAFRPLHAVRGIWCETAPYGVELDGKWNEQNL